MARFYPGATVEAQMDLPGRWPRKHGRPLAACTDRHRIFEPQDKGQAPKAATAEQANEVLARLVPAHDRRFAEVAEGGTDAHRALGPGHDPGAILPLRAPGAVSNDYAVRPDNRFYQPPPPPGLRGGRVRSRGAYLAPRENPGRAGPGALPPAPRGLPLWRPMPARRRKARPRVRGPGAPACGRPAGARVAPAEPYPPGGGAADGARRKGRPARDHPYSNAPGPPKRHNPDSGHA